MKKGDLVVCINSQKDLNNRIIGDLITYDWDDVLELNMIYEVIHAENNSIDNGIVVRRLDLNSTNLYSKKRFESIKKIRKEKIEKLNEEG